MRIKFAGLALVALVSLAQSAEAAPIQGVVRATGGATFSGLSGEIFLALRGPDEILLRNNALDVPNLFKDATLPGEIAYLGLSGINGTVDMGNVVVPSALVPRGGELILAYQVSNTSAIVETTATKVAPGFQPPAGQAGLWVEAVPEPGTLGLASLSLLGLAFRRRRAA